MKNILDVLSKKHSTWLKYILSFGCSSEIAEDFVQEMYIKIYIYSQKKDNNLMYNENEINYFFIYVTLKNMYYDNLRRNKNIVLIGIEEVNLIDDIVYTESTFNNQSELLKCWEFDINNRIESIKEYNSEKASLFYIKFVYQKIFIEKISVSELSREVDISYWSLRNTIQIIKEQIKNGSKR
jgi:DNA-directed RNA polymerase specialized sigma24 family protein